MVPQLSVKYLKTLNRCVELHVEARTKGQKPPDTIKDKNLLP